MIRDASCKTLDDARAKLLVECPIRPHPVTRRNIPLSDQVNSEHSKSNASNGATVSKTPTWFMVVGVLALLWNLMGLMAFVAQMFITEEMIEQMPVEQQPFYNDTPMWANIAFGVAVVFGVLGCPNTAHQRTNRIYSESELSSCFKAARIRSLAEVGICGSSSIPLCCAQSAELSAELSAISCRFNFRLFEQIIR